MWKRRDGVADELQDVDVLPLRSRFTELTQYEYARSLDQGCRWEAAFFTMRLSQRLVPDVEPKFCWVRPVQPMKLYHIWEPGRRKRRTTEKADNEYAEMAVTLDEDDDDVQQPNEETVLGQLAELLSPGLGVDPPARPGSGPSGPGASGGIGEDTTSGGEDDDDDDDPPRVQPPPRGSSAASSSKDPAPPDGQRGRKRARPEDDGDFFEVVVPGVPFTCLIIISWWVRVGFLVENLKLFSRNNKYLAESLNYWLGTLKFKPFG